MAVGEDITAVGQVVEVQGDRGIKLVGHISQDLLATLVDEALRDGRLQPLTGGIEAQDRAGVGSRCSESEAWNTEATALERSDDGDKLLEVEGFGLGPLLNEVLNLGVGSLHERHRNVRMVVA